MKKLMFALAFACFSLCVSANSVDLIEKINFSEFHLMPESEAPTSWSVTFNCGGYSETYCCFETYMDAVFFANFARPCEEEVPG
jgi:hypothetical protein